MSVHIQRPMKKFPLLPVAALLVVLASCQKDNDSATPDLPIEVCGIDGMRLQADLDGSETCFSASLIGNLADGQLTIGGVNPTSGSLALQLDDLTVGTYAATDSTNHIFLVAGGVAFQSTDGTPGSITISSHNQSGNHIKGSFSAQLAPANGSPAKSVSGTFDMTYLEQ